LSSWLNVNLVNFHNVLDTQPDGMPQDFVVPGAISSGDIPILATAIALRP